MLLLEANSSFRSLEIPASASGQCIQIYRQAPISRGFQHLPVLQSNFAEFCLANRSSDFNLVHGSVAQVLVPACHLDRRFDQRMVAKKLDILDNAVDYDLLLIYFVSMFREGKCRHRLPVGKRSRADELTTRTVVVVLDQVMDPLVAVVKASTVCDVRQTNQSRAATVNTHSYGVTL